MEPERSFNVWVSVKCLDADGNAPKLDEEEVEVTNDNNLVQLVQATVKQLNDVLPPIYDHVVVSKYVSATLDEAKFVRIRASKLVREKCEGNRFYRVELLRPGDDDPKVEPEEAAEVVNELDEHDVSWLMAKIEDQEQVQPNHAGDSQDGEGRPDGRPEGPRSGDNGSTLGDGPDFAPDENNPRAEDNVDALLPAVVDHAGDLFNLDDGHHYLEVEALDEGNEDADEGQLFLTAPTVERQLSLQELREAAKRITVRSLGRFGRHLNSPRGSKQDFRVTCPVCEDTFAAQAGYADAVKHLIEAHLANYLDSFPYKCCVGNCAFGAFDERSMCAHLGKAHKITKKAERPTDACYNHSGRLLYIELLDFVKNGKK